MQVIGFDRSSNFALGAGGISVSKKEIFNFTDKIIAWSGVGHVDIYNHVQTHKLDYYYIDTGYFGNHKHKTYKRITFNNLNDSRELIERPRDRLEKISINKEKISRGNSILIVPPDQKVLGCWNPSINAQNWKLEIVEAIKNHTDRPIKFRERIASRAVRLLHDTFAKALQDDVYAVVTWSSNCAVESILHNIPVISLGPTATKKVSSFNIEDIDNIPVLDKDLIDLWLRHLSYCQFTEQEMLSGKAWEYLRP